MLLATLAGEHRIPLRHGLAQGLYDDAVKLLGERGLVEIIGLCGYYTLVSMTLNAFEVDLPGGEVSELT